MKLKIKKIKLSKRRRRRVRNETEEKELKTVKCLVFGDEFLDENESEITVDQTKFQFWQASELIHQSRAFTKQYLAYHHCQILFFIINIDGETFEEKILELSSLIDLNIIE